MQEVGIQTKKNDKGHCNSQGCSNTDKNTKTKPKAPSRKVVDPSALAWETVGEDFGGLQVIRNVEVVRDGDRVKFAVAEGADDKTATESKKEKKRREEQEQESHRLWWQAQHEQNGSLVPEKLKSTTKRPNMSANF